MHQYSLMQSDSPNSNDELPQDFTSRIINIIQNKQHVTEEINLDSQTEEDSELYNPPQKQSKSSCKKSGKKGTKDTKGKENNRRVKKNKYQLSQKSEQESNNFQALSQEQSSPFRNQPTKQKNTEDNKKQIQESHQILKQYFQSFLTKVVKKMEDSTNKVLSSLIKRTDALQGKIESLTSQKQTREIQTDPDLNSAQMKQKKQPYIKAWVKMNYVERIQRKQMTVKEAAKELKIRENVVQQWLSANKKKKTKASNFKSVKLNNLKKKMNTLQQKKIRNDNPPDLDSDFLQEVE